MPWIIGGLGLVGGLMQGQSAKDAASTQADAQLRAAQLAAEESRFRPVGVTTRFGQSNFQYDPSGRVVGAGYTVAPQMQAYQNRLMGLAGQGLTQAEQAQQQYQPLTGAASNLFNLGQQYLAQSPQQVAADYMAKQQELLAPSRERQYSQLQNQLFQTGRGGLSVGATSARPSGAAGLGATTPETEAYYNALAQQDAQLAAQAQQAGQQQTAFGAGLFGTGAGLLGQYQTGQVGALSPFQSYLQSTQGIEQMGQQPLDIGINIGAKGMSPSATNAMYAGGTNAANTMAAANAYNPFATALIQGAQNPQIRNAISSGGWGGGSDAYLGKSGGWGFDISKLFG
jgi:hypothetical protein